MVTVSEILEKIAGYLANVVDADHFEDWIASNTWNVHHWGDEGVQFLAYSVELALSERSSGHLPEAQFRAELESILLAYQLRSASAAYSFQIDPAAIVSRIEVSQFDSVNFTVPATYRVLFQNELVGIGCEAVSW